MPRSIATTKTSHRRFCHFAWAASLIVCLAGTPLALAEETPQATAARLRMDFARTVKPFLATHCLGCHGKQQQEAKLDLAGYTSMEAVNAAHPTWETVLERVEAKEMPPADAKRQPDPNQRAAVVAWIRALRMYEANRTAGDPGAVFARRLSNAEYNNTIRDLTGIDMRPTQTFPVDPANAAGFDNTGESLTISPALLNKYLGAARQVADHLVMTPTELTFAPHAVVTATDRDKYCVKRIVQFYRRQPTDLASYFLVCWQHGQRPSHRDDMGLAELARQASLSEKYTSLVWDLLHEADARGPTARLQEMFRAIGDGEDPSAITACQAMRDYVHKVRRLLSPKFPNLYIEGNHKGSQPFVLWKNQQYSRHRRKFAAVALGTPGDTPQGLPPELALVQDDEERAIQMASLERFCATFPDAFYISERGRDYLDVPRESQEKGRLLSAGFHSMMGYFRDDAPLCELILDDEARQELDRLWRELDYVASAPSRQYAGFLWFERTDSRYMRDPVFDFARAEDKNAATEAMINKLADVYLEKAKRSGGSAVAIEAIEDFFQNINRQIRAVEKLKPGSAARHLDALLTIAERAWRRKVSDAEAEEIRDFYQILRMEERLDHEEAVRDSLVSILMSPHFLFRVDLGSVGNGTRSLTRAELASRLSYFLWATTPDDTLLRWAVDPVREPNSTEVALQAARMLRDAKIRGLATEFAANWLDVRRFEEHNSVDRDRFPEFNDELRHAMFEEPLRFFVDLVQNDRSVLSLLDADYTFVNASLAKHYDVRDVAIDGEGWVRLERAQRYGRGGLLPMSVFLTKNAPGLRTSPVKRGYWVVRQLLGERIPPPPPNVPELPADESQLGDLSLRDMLARHRDNQSCAGCHDRFDAIGLALEGYGPVGERRENDLGGRPVEVSAQFPGGAEGSGLAGLRDYLLQHRQQDFIDNLCRKLLSYGLGRTLTLSDEPLIAKMKSQLVADEYRFSSLITSIVTSRQFLHKRGREPLLKDQP